MFLLEGVGVGVDLERSRSGAMAENFWSERSRSGAVQKCLELWLSWSGKRPELPISASNAKVEIKRRVKDVNNVSSNR